MTFLLAGTLILTLGTGCDLFQVSNPNNLTEDQIDPTSVTSLANGAEASVTRALGAMHAPYSTASGELTWIGSRNAWGELDNGSISNPGNEFSDQGFPYFGEATWLTRDYINRLESFRENDDLDDVQPLVRTYLYGAIIYTSTADIFDNFVLSDRADAGTPVGPNNMDTLYDQAISWLDKAISLAEQNQIQQPSLATLYSMRARAKYSKALWGKLNPDVTTGMASLVNSSGAVADAQAALNEMGAGSDFRYELELIPSAPNLVDGAVSMAFQINSRRELNFTSRYITVDAEGNFESVIFEDALSGEVHPYLRSFINNFVSEGQYADVPVVSQREMYLILAEAALAGNGSLDFETQINKLRALDGLPAYDRGSSSVSALDLLNESREVNLYLQGRRLADHYRFEDPAEQWTNNRDSPGTFFPITLTEIRANPNLSQ